jgi:hypothetical protein
VYGLDSLYGTPLCAELHIAQISTLIIKAPEAGVAGTGAIRIEESIGGGEEFSRSPDSSIRTLSPALTLRGCDYKIAII